MWIEPFKDKNGQQRYRFVVKYKDPSTNKWKRTSVVMNRDGKQSQKEAERRLQAKIQEKINDKKPKDIKMLTLHQVIDEWFKYHSTTSGNKQRSLEVSAGMIKRIKDAVDSDLLLLRTDETHAQSVIDLCKKDNLSDYTTGKTYALYKRILRYAKQKYKLDDIDYLDYITPPKQAVTREQLQAKRENYLELQQVKALANELLRLSSEKKLASSTRSFMITAYISEFQMLNGMRIGELLAIQNEDIDYERKKLKIDGTIVWNRDGDVIGFKDTAKTAASYRTISLCDRSIEILKKVQLENKTLAKWYKEEYNDRGFIFTNIKGNPMNYVNVSKYMQIAAENIGIKKHISTHTMRHAHISLLSQLGVSLKAIMERVGHSDHKTTLQIYSHVTEQMDKDMMAKLNELQKISG